MNMEDILTNVSDLFVGNGIIIVIGCFVIGTILKGTIKKLPNKYIPYINSVVSVILGFVIPGQVKNRIQIIPQNRPLGGAKRLFFEPVYILQKLLFHVRVQFQVLDSGGIAFTFVLVVLFSQLFPDDLHLLAQIVVPLILVENGFRLLLDLPFQPQHLHLPVEEP